MLPLHFGESNRKLYGVFTPGMDGPARGAVLLCYPFGQEYMRAHRAFRQLATLLSKRGLSSLRFDYYGTGDSAGAGVEADFETWVGDALSAIDELKAMTSVEAVDIVGLRLGATVACYAAHRSVDVNRVVLWDPVVSGLRFAEEAAAMATDQVEDTLWVHGFPMSARFRAGLDGVDLRTLTMPKNSQVLEVVSHEAEGFQELGVALENHPGGFEFRVVPSPGDWNYVDDVGSILLPQELVKSISDWLGS